MPKFAETLLIPIVGSIIAILIFFSNFTGTLSKITSITVAVYNDITSGVYNSTQKTLWRLKSLVHYTTLQEENLKLRQRVIQLEEELNQLKGNRLLCPSANEGVQLKILILNYPKPGYSLAYSSTPISYKHGYITNFNKQLIGKAAHITGNWVVIQTLYSADTNLLVFLPKTKEFSLLTYSHQGLELKEMPINSNVSKGDPVYLYDKNLTSPIYVGTVAKINKDPGQPYLQVLLRTGWTPNSIDNVTLVPTDDTPTQ